MYSYDVFFWGALFFLVGILFKSLGLNFSILVITILAAAIFSAWWFFVRRANLLWFAGLTIFIVFGALYFSWNDFNFKNESRVLYDEKLSLTGVVVNDPLIKTNSQEFKLKLVQSLKGNVLLKTATYPRFHYGDELRIEGKIIRPEPDGYASYLAKEGIVGVISLPKIELVSTKNGSSFKSSLYNIKNKIIDSFRDVLPQEEATFLAGLTLGSRNEQSDDFKQALSLSGTTHLVALSGYNITVMIWVLLNTLLFFLSRRVSFPIIILFVIGFVLMTGAEASVVRAAIMAMLVILAQESGRIFSLKNAIIFAGLIMVIINPKILVFDVGFQLSFLALLGIVYLKPALQGFFRMGSGSGFLSWKENLMTTASAQLMVAPLLISSFSSFSLTSLLANVVILEAIPITMGIGFMVAVSSFISYYVSLIFGWVALILLRFEILAIKFFASISLPITSSLSYSAIVMYYCLIIVFIYYASHVRKFKE
ncbi:MAG: ComEC/Rec2 family competence protein [Patescibacteria group bacterium]